LTDFLRLARSTGSHFLKHIRGTPQSARCRCLDFRNPDETGFLGQRDWQLESGGREKGKEAKDEVNRHDVVRFVLSRRSCPPWRCVGVACNLLLLLRELPRYIGARRCANADEVHAGKTPSADLRPRAQKWQVDAAARLLWLTCVQRVRGPPWAQACTLEVLCVWSAAAGFAAAAGVHRARCEGGGVTQPVFVQARAVPPRFACESSVRAQSHWAPEP